MDEQAEHLSPTARTGLAKIRDIANQLGRDGVALHIKIAVERDEPEATIATDPPVDLQTDPPPLVKLGPGGNYARTIPA